MSKLVRFGPFELDTTVHELRKHGVRVRLRDQSIEVLTALLDHPGGLVTRDELQTRLWPGVHFADFDNGLNSAVNRLREALGDRAGKPCYIETVPRRGYRFIGTLTKQTPAAPRRLKLAVLPIANLTGDPADEYLADGVTEELITQLAGVDPSRLGVIARTSAMKYKLAASSAAEIGRDLRVDYLLEGSLRRDRERARVTIQLIRVDDETHLWAKSYDGSADHILSFQDKIAHAVAQAIEVAIPTAVHRHVSPAAWDCFIRGLFHFNLFNGGSLDTAVKHFHEALALEPDFPACWAKLAAAWSAAAIWGFRPPREAYPKAEAAARQALELDDGEAGAHSALAEFYWYYKWDLAAAESELERALELGANNPNIQMLAGVFFASMRSEFPRAFAHTALALELDPLSVVMRGWAAWPEFWARRYDRAIALCEQALDMDPSCLMARYALGLSHLFRGAADKAIAVFEDTAKRFDDIYSLGYLGMAFGKAGRRSSALVCLDQLEERARHGHVSSVFLAWIWIGLGEKPRALDYLEQAWRDRDLLVLWMRVSPNYDSMRSEPRFDALVKLLPLAH